MNKINVSNLVEYIKQRKLLSKQENLCVESSCGINWDFVAADIYIEIGHKVDDTIIDDAFDVLERDIKKYCLGWGGLE
jgi:hypothetical protein